MSVGTPAGRAINEATSPLSAGATLLVAMTRAASHSDFGVLKTVSVVHPLGGFSGLRVCYIEKPYTLADVAIHRPPPLRLQERTLLTQAAAGGY
jgi:hypothetical protein